MFKEYDYDYYGKEKVVTYKEKAHIRVLDIFFDNM